MKQTLLPKLLLTLVVVLCGCNYDRISDQPKIETSSVNTNLSRVKSQVVTVCDCKPDQSKTAANKCFSKKLNLRKYALMAMMDTKQYLTKMQNGKHSNNASCCDTNSIADAGLNSADNPIDTLLRNIPNATTFDEESLIIFAASEGKPFSRDLIVKYKTKEGLWLMTLQMQDYVDANSSASSQLSKMPDYKGMYVSSDKNQPMFYYDSKNHHSQMLSRAKANSGMFDVFNQDENIYF
nr:hypothetical protein [Bacteroidota bacterium]